MDKSVGHIINVTGLVINMIGALLLVLFTSPNLDVTETGESFVRWTNSPPSDQRVKNRRKYAKHKHGFKAGVVLLTLGYALQVIAGVFF